MCESSEEGKIAVRNVRKQKKKKTCQCYKNRRNVGCRTNNVYQDKPEYLTEIFTGGQLASLMCPCYSLNANRSLIQVTKELASRCS